MSFSLTLVLAFVSAAVFSAINLLTPKLGLTTAKRKASALSFFGGVSAAFVFLDLLPSLQQAGTLLKDVTGGEQLVNVYEDAIFLLVFVGFLTFFVIEHLAVVSRRKQQVSKNREFIETYGSRRVFTINLVIFCLFNAILSFVLFFEYSTNPITGALYTFAVALHLIVANDSMIEHYKHYQLKLGRYVGAVIPFLGFFMSVFFPERLAEAYVLLALISGVILYHSIKNEVPSATKKQNLGLFIVGAVFYSVILLVHALTVA